MMGLSRTTGLTLQLSDHASGNHIYIYTSSSEHIVPDRERAQRPSQPRRRHPQVVSHYSFHPVDRPPFGINSGRGIKFWMCLSHHHSSRGRSAKSRGADLAFQSSEITVVSTFVARAGKH
jgi:hypothetical protein